MTTVFDLFREVEMEFLTISRGDVYGNRIIDEKPIMGIFKDKSGMNSMANQETRESNATVHVHPEDFTDDIPEIVGNGIRYKGKEYSIIGATEGRNFDTNEVEHIKLTLERANYVCECEN